jgi:transposase
VHIITDASGNPMQIKLGKGNLHDVDMAFEFLEELPSAVKDFIADKGYDANLLRESLRYMEIKPVIPGRSSKKEKIIYDKEKYHGRHVVENFFCRLKQFRSVSTRYEKLATNFLSMVNLACALCWIKL